MKITIDRDYNQREHDDQYLEKRNKYLNRGIEAGIKSEKSGASVTTRDNGEVNISTGIYNNTSYTKDGTKKEVTIQSVTETNRKFLYLDELIINDHKLNPRIYEWSDMREINGNNIIGNFTADGTVLVKAWEPDLGKYVLIRRKTRQPLFGQELNMADFPEDLDI